MRNINLRYVKEKYDDKGNLTEYKMEYPSDFNFGYDVVDDIALNEPDRRALIWCNTTTLEEKTISFAEIKKYSDKTANFLTSLGIKKGDMVLVVMKHHYQYWYVMVALHKMGAIAIPATFMLKPHDVEYRINSASVKAVVCTNEGDVADAFDAATNVPTLEKKIYLGKRDGWIDLDAGIEAASDKWEKVPTKVSDPLLMYFSSGTTGHPKMIMHDHSYPIGHIITAKHWHCVEPDGIHFTIADTGWAKAAWGKMYGQWIMESTILVLAIEKFIPKQILSFVSKFKVTTLCCPPTMFRMFLVEGDIKSHDLSPLQHTTIAGEALSAEVFNKWYDATGLKLREGFGQSETTVVIGYMDGTEPRPGSMGKPLPQYIVDIIDENGKSCPPGIVGEIVIGADPRPAGLMMGYYRDEEKTASTVYDGYHHTGDVAFRDSDGYYTYVGRNDDVIKSSGYRIGPFEIESVLVKHPAILECAVTGVPDDIRGQLVKATIVLKNGYQPSDELKKDIQNFVKKETAPYKYPRAVEFVNELPKTASGKIKRVDIRKKDFAKG